MELKALWDFMQVDMEADRFDKEIRQSPKRLALLKQRNFLMEQQNNMKQIEADIAAMTDRLEALDSEAERLSKVLEGLLAKFESEPPKSPEEVEKQEEAVRKLLDDISRYEQEITRLHKDSATKDRQQRDIRMKAAKMKAEYDQNKLGYDTEFKRDTAKLKQLRGRAEEEGKKIEAIDAGLFNQYKTIKEHVVPPIARLNGNQCGGCFMEISKATQLAAKEGSTIVNCDNCGRILYAGE